MLSKANVYFFPFEAQTRTSLDSSRLMRASQTTIFSLTNVEVLDSLFQEIGTLKSTTYNRKSLNLRIYAELFMQDRPFLHLQIDQRRDVVKINNRFYACTKRLVELLTRSCVLQ